MKIAYHVTPTKNIKNILKHGLIPNKPEESGDLAVSLFKTLEDAKRETKSWLFHKFNQQPLSLIEVEITGLVLTETFSFELITCNANPIPPSQFKNIYDFSF